METVVESNSSTIAGPARRAPAGQGVAVVDRAVDVAVRPRRSRRGGAPSARPPARARAGAAAASRSCRRSSAAGSRPRPAPPAPRTRTCGRARRGSARAGRRRPGSSARSSGRRSGGRSCGRSSIASAARPSRSSSPRPACSSSAKVASTSSASRSSRRRITRHGRVELQVGREEAGGGEDAGAARDQQRRHLGVAGERVRVHGPGAAEAEEDEVARVVAALDGDQVERVDHRGVRDLDDPVRRLGDVEPERLAQRSSIARRAPSTSRPISPPRK